VPPQYPQFPDIPARPSRQLDVIEWEPPFDSHLARVDKSIMLEPGRVAVQRADDRDAVAVLGKDLDLVQRADIGTGFLNAADHPRYIKHLLDSRGISEVILSNSQLVYEMRVLQDLRAKLEPGRVAVQRADDRDAVAVLGKDLDLTSPASTSRSCSSSLGSTSAVPISARCTRSRSLPSTTGEPGYRGTDYS
jgi:hypothetical protein